MSKSSEHLYRCLDIMKADPNLSEETRIIMFIEYAKLTAIEDKATEWYPWPATRPDVSGRYEVYRGKCQKQQYETWNGTGWAYNANDITFWRVIKAPRLPLINRIFKNG